jgi:hypothetical protein
MSGETKRKQKDANPMIIKKNLNIDDFKNELSIYINYNYDLTKLIISNLIPL